jgi:hypothetical protein
LIDGISTRQLAEWGAEARERWSVSGLAFGVLSDGNMIVASDGIHELGRTEAVSPETTFRIASTTRRSCAPSCSNRSRLIRRVFPREGFVDMGTLATRVR